MWGGEGTDDGQFRFATRVRCDSAGTTCATEVGGAVAVDEHEQVYVADWANHRIQKFDRHGRLLTRWGSQGDGAGQFVLPRGIAVDRQDRVYVSDTENRRIQVFDGEGRFLTQWPSRSAGGGQTFQPGVLSVAGQDQLIVASAENGWLHQFDTSGRLLGQWPTGASQDGLVWRVDGTTRPGTGWPGGTGTGAVMAA
jgi:DNA-binding beta-propeller fold protein YncE